MVSTEMKWKKWGRGHTTEEEPRIYLTNIVWEGWKKKRRLKDYSRIQESKKKKQNSILTARYSGIHSNNSLHHFFQSPDKMQQFAAVCYHPFPTWIAIQRTSHGQSSEDSIPKFDDSRVRVNLFIGVFTFFQKWKILS